MSVTAKCCLISFRAPHTIKLFFYIFQLLESLCIPWLIALHHLDHCVHPYIAL